MNEAADVSDPSEILYLTEDKQQSGLPQPAKIIDTDSDSITIDILD